MQGKTYLSSVAISWFSMHIFFYIFLSYLPMNRDKLHDELEKLRDEQIYMERDISCLQARWHALREEKAKAANLLRDVTKTEEDLERLAEEKSQLDLDVKVCLMGVFFILFSTCLSVRHFYQSTLFIGEYGGSNYLVYDLE